MSFQHYAVGGCVRDTLLGIAPKDYDYVVLGETPETMLNRGFQQVGAQFPVFLHPTSGCEYALARTEQKSGNGYHGFVCDFNPSSLIDPILLSEFHKLGFNDHDDYEVSDLIKAFQRIAQSS